MNHTVRVDRPSEQVLPVLVNTLQCQGLRSLITFDLQLARSNQTDFHCPHHGKKHCTCQYAVVLVHDPKQGSGISRTIVVQGRDSQVLLSLLKSPELAADKHAANETLGRQLLDLLLVVAGTFADRLAEGPIDLVSG